MNQVRRLLSFKGAAKEGDDGPEETVLVKPQVLPLHRASSVSSGSFRAHKNNKNRLESAAVRAAESADGIRSSAVADAAPVAHGSMRVKLQRTRSRSADTRNDSSAVAGAYGSGPNLSNQPQRGGSPVGGLSMKKSIVLRSHRNTAPREGSPNYCSEGEENVGFISKKARSQSYYMFRPRPMGEVTQLGSSPALSSSMRQCRRAAAAAIGPSAVGGANAGPASFVRSGPCKLSQSSSFRLLRCGSTPPINRGSLGSLRGPSGARAIALQDGFSPNRLQSEENLLLDLQRKQEKSWIHHSRFKEETSVMKNIRQREMIEMRKKEGKVPPSCHQSQDESLLSSTPPSGQTPSLSRKKNLSTSVATKNKSAKSYSYHLQNEGTKLVKKNSIASGLLGTRTILLAPTAAAALANPLSGMLPSSSAIGAKVSNWVPPPQQKPKDRQLVRKVVSARLKQYKNPSQPAAFRCSDFIRECLEWHNYYRSFHGAEPLELDEELCASSQYWANLLAHRDDFYHQNPADLGENLFAWPIPIVPQASPTGTMPDIRGKEVAAYWYKTMRSYYFLKDPEVLHAHAGPFSQMIWLSTRHFGCGKARSHSGKLIVVALYFPRGNIPGEFHLNVLPPTDKFVGEDEDNFQEEDGGTGAELRAAEK